MKRISYTQHIELRLRIREFVVVYEETDQEVRLITIHPLKPYQKFGRIQSKRWQKL
ncbi:MAG: hypothetical protein AAB524_01830 [Patescibacteria group bacterium]